MVTLQTLICSIRLACHLFARSREYQLLFTCREPYHTLSWSHGRSELCRLVAAVDAEDETDLKAAVRVVHHFMPS